MLLPGAVGPPPTLTAPPQFCLELYNPRCRGQRIKACKTDGDGRVVEGKHESYRISAASAEERDQWIQAIR